MKINEAIQKKSISDIIQQAKMLMQAKKIADAEIIILGLLDQDKDNLEGLYILSVCQRYLQKFKHALQTLEKIKVLNPDYGRTYQEEGHIYRQHQAVVPAIEAYNQAVLRNPALLACWQALADLYQQQANHTAAKEMREQVQRLSALPIELLSVNSMLHEGKLYKAEQLCRNYLQKMPHHVEAMRLLASIGVKMHVLDDAEFLLESCVEFYPNNTVVRFDYADVLYKRQKFAESLEQAEKLHNEDPTNLAFSMIMANCHVGAGNIEAALSIYNKVLQQTPDNPNVLLMLAHALKAVDKVDEAIAAYQKAYKSKPDFGDAFWSLANLKTYRFSDAEINMMQHRQTDEKTALVDRFHFCFALGKAFEDKKDYAVSMEYYQLGNSLKKQQSRYKSEHIDEEFQTQTDTCTSSLFALKKGSGNTAADPIFIVGLPRAGSTLLEQILSSHSQVDGTMELPNIASIVNKLNGRQRVDEEHRYPGNLHELSPELLAKIGEEYINSTQIYRQNAPYFIDKMPNNFRHIGLIHLILPNAKIIDARRHPMACCFSGFKQLFAEGQEFTYGQEEIGRYYKGYTKLMAHWEEVLPGRVLRVQYEDVVDDLDTQVKRILDYCGLPFEDACLEFHKTVRAVKTPSSEQVRQPIYKTGLEQWKNFEPYLGALKKALSPLAK
ncbi:tetratricopeptide repeat-containing sulfotransferase family protein [uncultured Paraglaciecola sp.]|uniref:tetratricopeptide repeat-containing sulfotransferase family protein n=1 Tax=uncultured Paraglaciecola sp. TaxID=1765024 RepID=UPI0025FFC87A|nr:tetratricopeptide repeat-containing sulfotransferase family protein [uncultured Paraglaciecola sp.]